MKKLGIILIAAVVSTTGFSQKKTKPALLKADNYKHYVDYFNTMEDENIVQAIPNAQSWEWMKQNIPLFECPQQNFEELFYYRWWTLRKHIKQTPQGYVFTEFLIQRSYADKYNMISSALGHHIYEGRWLHNDTYLNDDVHVWFRGNDGKPLKKMRSFSSWTTDALYNRYLVNNDSAYLINMLPDLEADYSAWEADRKLPNGLFWQADVKDGMEETISGGRKEKNARPTINSYMYGNAKALANIENLAGKNATALTYATKADTLKGLIENMLWNKVDTFFETRKTDTLANVREAIGFIPWYFNLPTKGNDGVWKYVTDTKAFNAPFGLTTAERSDPQFRGHGCCKCEWDGAVWPYATSQTMTALANAKNNYNRDVVSDSAYFKLLEVYVESMHYRGRPYVGEYLDEKTGYWLKGDEERSRYYNHSTFNDLIITGLIGLRPRADNVVEVNPLIPQNKWDWFCLDNILYHGHIITIVWDKDGTKYKKGNGLSLWVDGKKKTSIDNISKLTATL